jgi:hypothetical protein
LVDLFRGLLYLLVIVALQVTFLTAAHSLWLLGLHKSLLLIKRFLSESRLFHSFCQMIFLGLKTVLQLL